MIFSITVVVNIVVAFELLVKSNPVFHAAFTIANAAITNTMACRAFKQLILDALVETVHDTSHATEIIMTDIMYVTPPSNSTEEHGLDIERDAGA